MAKVVLSDGKEVEISGVLFNKEQNINISKTYITTVKKSVTKVSEDFYKVAEAKKNEESPIFEAMSQTEEVPKAEEVAPVVEEPKAPESVAPALEEVAAEIPGLPEVEPVLPEVVAVEEPKVIEPELPKVEPIPAPAPEVVSDIPPVIPVPEEPKVAEPVVEAFAPVQTEVPAMPTEIPSGVIPSIPEPEVAPVVAEPIPTVVPPVIAPPVEPVLSSPEPITASTEPQLLFDGSQETNLNQALGEVGGEKTLPTQEEGVASLREFGVDTPAAPLNVVPEVATPVESKGKVLTKSKGFANNKFFMVIAIVFFIAACVFLGYEAFRYFQLVK